MFNPQLNLTALHRSVYVPVVVPTYVSPRILSTGGMIAASAPAQTFDPLGVKGLADRFQKQFDEQIPNYLIGAIGLFLVFVGVTALAAPVAKLAAEAA